MAANASDMFQKVARSTATTLSAPGYTVGATSINVASTSNWPADTGITFGIDEVDGGGNRIAGTYNIFRGTVGSATQLANLTYVGGDANRNYSAGATTRVYILVSYARENRLVDGLLVSHDQDGTLKAGAVDVAGVLASNVVETAKIKDANVTTAKIADDAVTAPKIDWASTGANAGIWWEELGRTTLSSSGDTITVSSIPARKYLQIRANYSSTGGTVDSYIRFNNDGGANYASVYATIGGSANTDVSNGGIIITGAATSVNQYVVVDILNISNKEKTTQLLRAETNTTGAGTAPTSLLGVGKWANTSAQINRIDIANVSGTGDFAIGSELVVLGHN